MHHLTTTLPQSTHELIQTYAKFLRLQNDTKRRHYTVEGSVAQYHRDKYPRGLVIIKASHTTCR